MKKKNSIIATILAITMFCVIIPLGPTNKKTVNALSPDYITNNPSPLVQVYYFSDSEPTFDHILDTYIGVNVIYDVHPLLTYAELRFLISSGYFWGFDQSQQNIVIIEIKSFKIESPVLEMLLACLYNQGCEIMFISPYEPELQGLSFVNQSMPCNIDKYTRFLKYSIMSMLDEYGELGVGTTILIDGRFFGINGPMQSYDILDLCVESPTLRRMLLYMYYNCDTSSEVSFEEDLYPNVWQAYTVGYLDTPGVELNYLTDRSDVHLSINTWEQFYDDIYPYLNEENIPVYDPEDPASQEIIAEYNAYLNYLEREETYREDRADAIRAFYKEIIEELQVKDVHLLAHVDNSLYVDLMFTLEENYDHSHVVTTQNSPSPIYTFVNASDLFDWFDPLDHHIYSMGISRLKTSFTDFLKKVQQPNIITAHPTVSDVTYVWEDDDFIQSEHGLLAVLLEEDLRSLYGAHCEEGCAECTMYDQVALDELFDMKFSNFFT